MYHFLLHYPTGDMQISYKLSFSYPNNSIIQIFLKTEKYKGGWITKGLLYFGWYQFGASRRFAKFTKLFTPHKTFLLYGIALYAVVAVFKKPSLETRIATIYINILLNMQVNGYTYMHVYHTSHSWHVYI